MEMLALAEAFEKEQNKLEIKKKQLIQKRQKTIERKRNLIAQRKSLHDAGASLLKLEKAVALKLDELKLFNEVTKFIVKSNSMLNDLGIAIYILYF